jgi:hypothetical protein
VLLANRQNRDDDRCADEGSGDPPEESPEEHSEEQQKRRRGKCAARNPRFEIISNDELNEFQTDEDKGNPLPGAELCNGEERRDQWTDHRNVVERKSDDPHSAAS